MRIKRIEIEGNGVSIKLDDGSNAWAVMSDTARRQVQAMILNDFGIDYAVGSFGPEVAPFTCGHCGAPTSMRGACDDDCDDSRYDALERHTSRGTLADSQDAREFYDGEGNENDGTIPNRAFYPIA